MAAPSPSSAGKLHWIKTITPYALFTILITTLGPFQFGYHIAELNAPQAVLSCNPISPQPKLPPPEPNDLPSTSLSLPSCIDISAFQVGLITSIFTLGCLIGSLSGGPFSTTHGRRPLMLVSAACFTLGSLATATATSVTSMAGGRLLSGLGAGISLVVAPIYVSEISPEEGKGRLGALTQVMINTGVLLTMVLGYFLSYGNVWRVVLAAPALIGSLYGLGLLAVQESPRWLAKSGRSEEARRALGRLRRSKSIDAEIKAWSSKQDNESKQLQANADTSDENETLLSPSHAEFNDTSQHHDHHIGILKIVSSPHHRPAFLAVVVAQAGQQLTGINSVIMYSVTLLSALMPESARLLTVLVALVNLVATIVFAPLIDTLGRKTCLLISSTVMGLSSFGLALGLSLELPTVAGIATLTFVLGFAIGLGPVPFMLAAELVDSEAVGSLQSWSLGMNAIATFLVAQFSPSLAMAVGNAGLYIMFGTVGLIVVGLVWRFVPETKGCRTADEVWDRFKGERGRGKQRLRTPRTDEES